MVEKLFGLSRLGYDFNRCNFLSFCLKPLQVKYYEYSIDHRSTLFPLLSACRFVEFDASIIRHVFMHCFGSFLLQAMFLSLQVFVFCVFKRQNML